MRSKGLGEGHISLYLGSGVCDIIGNGSPVVCLEAFVEEGFNVKTALAELLDDRRVPLLHGTCIYDRPDVAAFLL